MLQPILLTQSPAKEKPPPPKRYSKTMSSDEGDIEYVFKVLLLGESSVGKTHLAARFVDGRVSGNAEPTIGVEFTSKVIVRNDGDLVRFQLWDTAGGRRFQHHNLGEVYRHTACVILVYDRTAQASFDALESHIGTLNATSEVNMAQMVVIVCGNKCDLPDPVISTEQGKAFAETRGFLFTETSAGKNIGVAELFELAGERLLQRVVTTDSRNSVEKNEIGDGPGTPSSPKQPEKAKTAHFDPSSVAPKTVETTATHEPRVGRFALSRNQSDVGKLTPPKKNPLPRNRSDVGPESPNTLMSPVVPSHGKGPRESVGRREEVMELGASAPGLDASPATPESSDGEEEMGDGGGVGGGGGGGVGVGVDDDASSIDTLDETQGSPKGQEAEQIPFPAIPPAALKSSVDFQPTQPPLETVPEMGKRSKKDKEGNDKEGCHCCTVM